MTDENKIRRRKKVKETISERIKSTNQIKHKNDHKLSIFNLLSEKIKLLVFSKLKKVLSKFRNILIIKLLLKLLKLLSLIILPRYLRNSWVELKQVTWPNFKLSRQLTFAVIVFAIFIGASVTGLDSELSKIFKVILLK